MLSPCLQSGLKPRIERRRFISGERSDDLLPRLKEQLHD